MTRDERWESQCNEVAKFIETSHRNPSKHWIMEHGMRNWLKANRKLMNKGEMKPDRLPC